MNVIAKNQIIDQKAFELGDPNEKKSIKQEMKHIYEKFSKEALNDVQKIKSDLIL